MPDQESGTPERTAYRLMEDVFAAENRVRSGERDRQYILDTYAECLKAVRGERMLPREKK